MLKFAIHSAAVASTSFAISLDATLTSSADIATDEPLRTEEEIAKLKGSIRTIFKAVDLSSEGSLDASEIA